MLAADKQALESVLQQQSLQIREKELRFFVENFAAVAGQAAMLAGFSFTGMFYTIDGTGLNSDVLEVCYFSFSAATLGLMVLACANCTLINVLGVGLALRGPKGSMDRAVREMSDERRVTFTFFGVGLTCFHITAILYALLMLHTAAATFVTIILTVFMIALYTNCTRIYNRLKLDTAESGQVVINGYAVGEGSRATVGAEGLAAWQEAQLASIAAGNLGNLPEKAAPPNPLRESNPKPPEERRSSSSIADLIYPSDAKRRNSAMKSAVRS